MFGNEIIVCSVYGFKNIELGWSASRQSGVLERGETDQWLSPGMLKLNIHTRSAARPLAHIYVGSACTAAEENSAETPPPCTITHSSIKNGRRAEMIQGLMLKYPQIYIMRACQFCNHLKKNNAVPPQIERKCAIRNQFCVSPMWIVERDLTWNYFEQISKFQVNLSGSSSTTNWMIL